MPRPLRLGFLVPQFPGQTHIFFWREIKALEEMGHHVRVISTRKPPPGLISHDWSQEAMDRTAYLGKLDPLAALVGLGKLLPKGLAKDMLAEGPGFAKDTLITVSAAQKLAKLCHDEQLDHVHAHSCGRASLVAALAEKLGGVPFSLTLHGPLSDYGPGQRYKWRNAAFATIITQKLLGEVRETLAGDLPDRLPIRPMGVDTQALSRTTPYAPPEKGRPIKLFSCARLNIVKGHQDLMQAVRLLLDQGVDVRLEIAGEDDMGGSGFRAELEEQLKTLHLQDHVKLLGAIDAQAVKAKLEEAHVFVLASWHEPLGVAYMEAMSMEVPTIGTNSGGVPELIEDGHTGLLVEPKNPGVLARSIRDLVANPERMAHYAKAGRVHVDAHFRSTLGAETLVEEVRLHRATQGLED